MWRINRPRERLISGLFVVSQEKALQCFVLLIDIDTIKCAKDKLLLTDSTGDPGIPICGISNNPKRESFTLMGGDVSFHFTSDASGSGYGFLATYKLIEKPGTSKYSYRNIW
jgi:hypothetical protein